MTLFTLVLDQRTGGHVRASPYVPFAAEISSRVWVGKGARGKDKIGQAAPEFARRKRTPTVPNSLVHLFANN